MRGQLHENNKPNPHIERLFRADFNCIYYVCNEHYLFQPSPGIW